MGKRNKKTISKKVNKVKSCATTIEKQASNKALVVGHPLSGYEDVISLLQTMGMKKANRLDKEGLDASEISNVILKSLGKHTSDFKALKQLFVSPIWNGLALDLVMSNIEQPFWGWADSDAISLLNFWKSLDSQISFILVYDTPQSFLEKLFLKNDVHDSAAIAQALEAWNNYNTELLNFYVNNPTQCLFINSQQMQDTNSICLEQISSKIGVKSLSFDSMKIQNLNLKKPEHLDQSLYAYLSDEVLKEYPQTLGLYEKMELISCSTFEQPKHLKVSVSDALFSAIQQKNDVVQMLSELDQELVESKGKYTELKEENSLQLDQLLKVQESLEEQHLSKEMRIRQMQTEKTLAQDIADKKINEVQKKMQSLEQKNKELNTSMQGSRDTYASKLSTLELSNKENEKEADTLLSQLHLVQEEMEKYYLENLELKEKIEALPQPKQKPYGVAEAIKKDYGYLFGQKMIEKTRTFKGRVSLPFSVYAEARKLKNTKDGKTKIGDYADAYDANRVQKHLSYQLGEAVKRCAEKRFCWIKLPWSLRSAYKEFSQSKLG